MDEVTIGVRELKSHLSEYLRRVRRGQTIVITDHGTVVGRIIPAEQPLAERPHSLQEAGLLAWGGQSLPAIDPPGVRDSRQRQPQMLTQHMRSAIHCLQRHRFIARIQQPVERRSTGRHSPGHF